MLYRMEEALHRMELLSAIWIAMAIRHRFVVVHLGWVFTSILARPLIGYSYWWSAYGWWAQSCGEGWKVEGGGGTRGGFRYLVNFEFKFLDLCYHVKMRSCTLLIMLTIGSKKNEWLDSSYVAIFPVSIFRFSYFRLKSEFQNHILELGLWKQPSAGGAKRASHWTALEIGWNVVRWLGPIAKSTNIWGNISPVGARIGDQTKIITTT